MPVKAKFIPPMLLLKTEKLPSGSAWAYQLKLDGYRAIAFKRDDKLHLRSRNDKDPSCTSTASRPTRWRQCRRSSGIWRRKFGAWRRILPLLLEASMQTPSWNLRPNEQMLLIEGTPTRCRQTRYYEDEEFRDRGRA